MSEQHYNEFVECQACQKIIGMATMCGSCISNRNLISSLIKRLKTGSKELAKARDVIRIIKKTTELALDE